MMTSYRFKEAIVPLTKGLGVVKKQTSQSGGVHTWPGTQIVIEESKPGKLQVRGCREPA